MGNGGGKKEKEKKRSHREGKRKMKHGFGPPPVLFLLCYGDSKSVGGRRKRKGEKKGHVGEQRRKTFRFRYPLTSFPLGGEGRGRGKGGRGGGGCHARKDFRRRLVSGCCGRCLRVPRRG